jgi:hypothetical protein
VSNKVPVLGFTVNPSGVQAAFLTIAPQIASNDWLPAGNRYRSAPKFLQKQIRRNVVNDVDGAQVVAASMPMHLFDSLTYLSRCLDAHFRRDYRTAQHLAYYAQLRVALSILASQGIGVFNHDHIIVDGAGSCHRLNNADGTHAAVWRFLGDLSLDAGFAQRLASRLFFQNISLESILSHPSIGRTSSATVHSWMSTWGIDVKAFQKDHDLRNAASYQPSQLRPTTVADAFSSVRILEEFWLPLEPAAPAFANIDRHLVRMALEAEYNEARVPAAATTRTVLNALGLSSVGVDLGVDFVTRSAEPDNLPLIGKAKKARNAVRYEELHLSMLARAVLLCRIAFALLDDLAISSGVSAASFAPYAVLRAHDAAFIGGGDPLPSAQDAWSEIEMALDDVSTRASGSDPLKFGDFLDASAYPLRVCCGAERLTMWAL